MSQESDNQNTQEKTLYFRVSGRVQGVFFRASTQSMADHYGLKGWVRNLPCGDVEGMVTGDEPRLNAFRGWLKEGPELAKILKLEVEEVEFQAFERFEIR
jgi:acylphosphatase